ncbi:MAG: ribosome-associated translation inhibitor RaiA [bacterium]|nr:ribosome-associated translation inhibitor RaiA [bacterium]
MKYKIRGDKVVITSAIESHITTKLNKLDKYFKEHEDITANILIKIKGKDQTVEVTIPTNKFILRGEENHRDLYAAIDLVTDKLERQIRKNKTRLKKKKHKDFNYDYEIEEKELDTNKIIKRKHLDTKPMDEEEAILEMNLLGHDFFVFKDIKTDNISVVYKRKDNNYGIIKTD